MEKTVTIDIEDVDNGAIFTEYDEEGCKYVSVCEEDNRFSRHNQFSQLGEIIFGEIAKSKLFAGKYRLTINIEEL